MAPAENQPFLVVDELMRIRAVSALAERLLGVTETDAVNRPVGEFLVTLEDNREAMSRLAFTIASASRVEGPAQRMVLRPRRMFGVRFGVRIGACSPGPAAILVLADAL